MLDAPVLGSIAHISLGLSRGPKRVGLAIVAHHGKAGGKLAGTTINQVADLRTVFTDADIYMMGHDHQRGAWPQSILHVSPTGHGEPRLHARRQWLCRTGSYLRAYAPGMASYAASRLLRPADLGGIELEIGLDTHDGSSVSAEVRAIV